MNAFDLSQTFGRVRMTGGTRVDFVQRMSTGDMRGLQAGEGRATVFTTPIGRMVDHTIVLALEDSLLLLTGGGNQGKLIRWLRKYIFFNDDVQLADETGALPMIGLFGEGADEWADGVQPGASQWSLHQHRDGLVKARPLAGDGYYWIGPNPPIAQPQLPITDYESLRIAAGYPAFPNEIGEDYIPLEAGLLSAISFSKGCYIGQEIIARMESRGQLAKKLVRLSVTNGGDGVQPGDRLLAQSADVGGLTSIAPSAAPGVALALGYVRTAHATEGAQLNVAQKPALATVLGPAGWAQ